jgi:hypothetical protein
MCYDLGYQVVLRRNCSISHTLIRSCQLKVLFVFDIYMYGRSKYMGYRMKSMHDRVYSAKDLKFICISICFFESPWPFVVSPKLSS